MNSGLLAERVCASVGCSKPPKEAPRRDAESCGEGSSHSTGSSPSQSEEETSDALDVLGIAEQVACHRQPCRVQQGVDPSIKTRGSVVSSGVAARVDDELGARRRASCLAPLDSGDTRSW